MKNFQGFLDEKFIKISRLERRDVGGTMGGRGNGVGREIQGVEL